jgi:hypothetical protein
LRFLSRSILLAKFCLLRSVSACHDGGGGDAFFFGIFGSLRFVDGLSTPKNPSRAPSSANSFSRCRSST